MKSTLLFSVFLICTMVSLGQQKKDTKITVTANDSSLFNKAVLLLYQRGYTLKEKDKELGFIATNDKSIKGTIVRLKVFVKDSSLTLTGDVYNSLASALMRGSAVSNISKDESYYVPIQNMGMKGSGMRDAWNELVSVAKQFGDQISYGK
jgi:hypothetical protein